MLGEKQHRLATWWTKGCENESCDGVIAEGSIRSGKTWAMITGFLLWSQTRFSGQSFIVAGRSMGSLKRNVIRPMRMILRDFGWVHEYNRSDNVITVGSNDYFFFGASTEASQDVLQGLTAAGCYADEVALFPKSFVDQMTGRCSVEGSKLWFNCNPSYPAHFFKTEWVDRAKELNLLHLHFDMGDNPTLSQAIKDRYERMYTGVFYDRYILGLWTMAEGLVYPAYKDALEPLWGGDGTRYVVSCDYGTQNAFAALLWAFDGSVWHCVKEYRYSGRDEGYQKTDADYVSDMKTFLGRLPRDTPFIIDPSATSFHAAMRRAGFTTRKARNTVADGIRETAAAMATGRVRIANNLDGLLSEFAGYVWDEKKNGDIPVKAEDHSMDALRYFVATMRICSVQSEEYESPFETRRVRDRIYNNHV